MSQLDCRELLAKHGFAQVAQNLDGLLVRHEDGFLRLGESLQSIAGASVELTSSTGKVAELTSGQELDASIEEMSGELETMRSLVERCAGAQALRGLTDMKTRIEEVRRQIPNFRRIVKTLQMLGISTRIESSRLEGDSGRGFATLADDIEKLAVNIVAHTGDILGNADELETHLGGAMQSVQEIQEEQKGKVEQGLVRIQENLESLVVLAEQSKELSMGLPERTRSIGRSVGEVVTSLQFHDIVRQQVEHISEAMLETLEMAEQICGCPDGTPAGAECREEPAEKISDSQLELLAWVADMCRLQQPQLGNAAHTLVDAVGRLTDNLGSIAGHVEDMNQEVGIAIQSGNTSEDDLLNQVERGVVDVARTMQEYAEQNKNLSGYMLQVAHTVGHMASFVEEIEEVGSEIELLALNASVKAAHTGDKGRALGVLAMAVQRLAGDAREQTLAVSTALSGIGELSARLTEDANRTELEGEVEALVQRLDQSNQNIRHVSHQVDETLCNVMERSEILVHGIKALTGSINVHEMIYAELDEAKCRLSGLEAELQSIVPEGTSEARSQRMQELLSRYTMEAERVVHLSAMGMEETEPHDGGGELELFGMDEDAPCAVEGNDTELDDNIELF